MRDGMGALLRERDRSFVGEISDSDDVILALVVLVGVGVGNGSKDEEYPDELRDDKE